MAQKPTTRTTYDIERVIQPIYTGGSVSLDQHGRVLATCLGEDALLTNLTTGEQLARIEGDGELITSLALTPSASHLIVCSRSLSMRIYSLRSEPSSIKSLSAELTRTLKPHTSPVVISTCDRTSTLLATGGSDGVVKVWDIRGGYVTHTFQGHRGMISALHFFEVQGLAQEQETSIHRKSKQRRRSDAKEERTTEVDGDAAKTFRLASGAEDGEIRIWDLHKRKSIASLHSHVSVVRGLQYSMVENALVSGSRDKTVMIWDAQTWKTRATVPVLEVVESTGFVGQAALIYTGGENGRVRLWETASGREVTQEQEPAGEAEGIVAIIYHDSLQYLITIHNDQTLILHSLASTLDFSPGRTIPPLPIIRRISGTHDEVIDLAYVGSNHSLLAVATNSEAIRILTLASPSPQPDDNPDAAPTASGGLFGADVALLKGHEEIIICLDVDWSGHWLVTGSKDNTARLWRIDPSASSYTCYAIFTGHAESIGAIALPKSTPPKDSPAYITPLEHPPQFLVTGSQDKTVKLWDISSLSKDTKKSPRAVYTRKAHDKDINSIDISHSSTLFASASQDRTVKIWATEEGEVQGVLRGHRRGVWSVKFAPKDTPALSSDSSNGLASSSRGFVLTGSGDKTVKIWSLADYSCLLTFEGHTNSVLKVLWLPTSSQSLSRGKQDVQIASAGGDGLVKIWDAQTSECACTLDNHIDRVWALAVNPNAYPSPPSSSPTPSSSINSKNPNHTLVSGSADSTITFWRDTTAATLAATTAASTARIEQDQALQNYIHNHSYREAITLALQLNHPARLLALFTSVVNTYPADEGSLSGVKAVDEVLASLGDEQLFALLLRLRDWNTNARTASVAQKILNVLVKSYPASRFISLRGKVGKRPTGNGGDGGAVGSVGKGTRLMDVLEGLRVYTERHLRRMEELWDESWLVDYTLREMDEVFGDAAGTNGINGHAVGNVGQIEDVVMVE